MKRKNYLLNELETQAIIAVLRKVEKEKTFPLVDTLIKNKINILEITLDTDNAYKRIKEITETYSDSSIVGAGTVLNVYQAQKAIDSGAEFIVSPFLNKDIIKTTLRNGKISIPGVMTVTEAMRALEYGADMIKAFPASALGPSFISGLKGPLPYLPIIPTGGINLDNVSEFINAGAIAVGVGGELIDNKLLSEEKFEDIGELAQEFLKKINT